MHNLVSDRHKMNEVAQSLQGSRVSSCPVIKKNADDFYNNLYKWTQDAGKKEPRLKAIVMRDQEIGMIARHFADAKGGCDEWVIERLFDDIASLG